MLWRVFFEGEFGLVVFSLCFWRIEKLTRNKNKLSWNYSVVKFLLLKNIAAAPKLTDRHKWTKDPVSGKKYLQINILSNPNDQKTLSNTYWEEQKKFLSNQIFSSNPLEETKFSSNWQLTRIKIQKRKSKFKKNSVKTKSVKISPIREISSNRRTSKLNKEDSTEISIQYHQKGSKNPCQKWREISCLRLEIFWRSKQLVRQSE